MCQNPRRNYGINFVINELRFMRVTKKDVFTVCE